MGCSRSWGCPGHAQLSGGGWWAGDPWLGWISSGYNPKGVGVGGKAIMLLQSPWQRLRWTAPHQCLAAVAQATHGLSGLLRLWGTQDLGKGGNWQPDGSTRVGGLMCPLPEAAALIAASFGLGRCLEQRCSSGVAPRALSQPRCSRAPSETSWHPRAFWGGGTFLHPTLLVSEHNLFPSTSTVTTTLQSEQWDLGAPLEPGIPPTAGGISGRR